MVQLFRRLRSKALSKSNRFYIDASLLWALAVGILDHFTGYRVRIAPLYLPSIFLIAWFTSLRDGLALCLSITCIWFSANYLAGQRYPDLLIPLWNFTIRFTSFAAFYFAVSSFRKERLFALQDPLTGIANRRALITYAAQEIKRSHRTMTPLSIAFIDCDDFKNLNDRWGHDAGDSFLVYVAQSVKKNIRSSDLVARVGGDEFVIILPETKAAEARHVCQELKTRLDAGLEHTNCPTTISMGVVTFNAAPATVDALLRSADHLMYHVKKAGKNSIEFRTVVPSHR